MKQIFYALLCSANCVLCIHSMGQAGTKDLSFGNNGLVSYQVYPSEVIARGVVATDSHIYTITAATNVQDMSLADSYIKCFDLNGNVNTNFGTDGVILFDQLSLNSVVLDSEEQRIYFLANPMSFGVQPQIGYVDLTDESVFLTPLNLDLTATFTSTFLARDDDGKLIYSGFIYHTLSENWTVFVGRLNADFTIDNTFSDDGYLELSPYVPEGSHGMIALCIDHNENIFINYMVDYVTIVSKISSNGSVDGTFSLAPEATATGALGLNADMKIAADNSIYIVNNGWPSQHIVKLNNDGSVNTTFADNGVLSIPQPSIEFGLYLTKLMEMPDGDLLVGGYCVDVMTGYGLGKYFLKISENGTIDGAFGSELQIFTYNNQNNYSFGDTYMTTQPDGKILCFDFIVHWFDDLTVDYDQMMTRFLNDGDVSAEVISLDSAGLIYPNPVNDFLNISFGTASMDNSWIEIIDGTGRLAFSGKLQSGRLDISMINEGMYCAVISCNGKKMSTPFIKN